MIITFKSSADSATRKNASQWLAEAEYPHKSIHIYGRDLVIMSPASKLTLEALPFKDVVDDYVDIPTEYQLCSRAFRPDNTVIDLGEGICFGAHKTVLMAGPCSVESRDQAFRTAEFLRETYDCKVFRAGAFKPRTSPYSFMGLGKEGLTILDEVRSEFGMKIITEVRDTTHMSEVADMADIVQIGTKAMYNTALQEMCGTCAKPVLLKRGFMATIKEFLQAADAIIANGNPNVILCERGIRTYEAATRFCLDVCAVAFLRDASHLPIVVDPSHAVGIAKLVPDVAKAGAAMGVDGLLIETHPDPSVAKSDKAQALPFDLFTSMTQDLRAICNAVKRDLI